MRTDFWKRISTFILALLLMCSFVSYTSAIDLPLDPIKPDATDPNIITGVCGKNSSLTWAFNTKTGTLSVFGNGLMKDRTSTEKTPWTSYVSNIKTIVIYPGVTYVGNYAFYSCTAAEAVIFCGNNTQWGEVSKGTNWSPSSVNDVKLHNFSEGVCSVCGFECTHETLTDDICSTCGMKMTMLGDVNGDESITNADVLAIYRYIYNQTLYPLDVTVADVNKDGNVTNADVLAIYRYIYNPTLYPLG